MEISSLLDTRLAAFKRHFNTVHHPLSEALQRLFLTSDYACRQVEILQNLLHKDNCLSSLKGQDYLDLANNIPHQPTVSFARSLRQFRHYHFLRLLLRELAGLANTQETMSAWSDCADALILRTFTFCQQELAPRFGVAYEISEKPAQLFVLAMGKLGGQELNYSSDIDLILAFSDSGQTTGPEQISNFQYYTKIVQLFIQQMQTVTADGFVFRVDLRLRPNGDSGALISSLAAMETYYQEQGRDWERYAMVKARLIGSDVTSSYHWFNRLIIPFTYRRYVDFSVIESLRSMKAMIEREIQLNPQLDDIKRGLGGIREIEFIIQTIQLIRGGRVRALKQQNALKALDAIKEEKLLPHTATLKQAYLFLRKLENCLQSQNDQQTHALPTDPIKKVQISLAMGYTSWEDLLNRLQRFQRIVSTIFHAVLGKAKNYQNNERVLTNQLSNLWQGHVEETLAVNLLKSLNYQDAERCYQLIHDFHQTPRCRRLNQLARLRLDRLMVLLLTELTSTSDTANVLLQIIKLLENIVGRSAYLALLIENPGVLNELVYWFSHSPFITSLLVDHPFLLEILLDQKKFWHPLSKDQLIQQLKNQLSSHSDYELQEEILRQFKLTHWLLAARAEMQGYVDAVRAGRFLADLAEVIIAEVTRLACEQLSPRHPSLIQVESQFAIIAYGKLGSREMNYNSDVDLVFIHCLNKQEEENLVLRLIQKIIRMLTTRSQAGILYEVDTRLRPSGEAGLLVTNFAAFINYQKTQAWTWEHQALIRSRILLGQQAIRQQFQQLKQEVALLQRSPQNIAHDVKEMREKIIRHLPQDNIIRTPGGLLDLEFLIQFLVLTTPNKAFSRYTHTLSLLQQLALEEKITLTQFRKLRNAYKRYHQLLHQRLLYPTKTLEFKSIQDDVVALYMALT